MAEPAQPPPTAATVGAPLLSRLFDAGVLLAAVLSVVVAAMTMGTPHLPLDGVELVASR